MELISKMKQKIHRDAVISLFDCDDDVKIFEDRVNDNLSLKNGIDYAVIDDHGNTVFHHVIKTGQNTIFDYLVEKVGRIQKLYELKYKDLSGNNLIMTSVQCKNWDVLQKFLHYDHESSFDDDKKLALCEELNKVKFVFLGRDSLK